MDRGARRLFAAVVLALALAGTAAALPAEGRAVPGVDGWLGAGAGRVAAASEDDSDGRWTIDPDGAATHQSGSALSGSDSDGRCSIDPDGATAPQPCAEIVADSDGRCSIDPNG